MKHGCKASDLAKVFDAARQRHVGTYEVPWRGTTIACCVDPRGDIHVSHPSTPDRERSIRPFKLGALEQLADAVALGD